MKWVAFVVGLLTAVQSFASVPEMPAVEFSHCVEFNGCRSCVIQKGGRMVQEAHLGCLGMPSDRPPSAQAPVELFQAPLAPADSAWRSFLPEMRALAYAVSYVMAPSTWKAESKWVDTNLARFKEHLTKETRRIEDTWKEARSQWAQTESSSIDLVREARTALEGLRAKQEALPNEGSPQVSPHRAETRFIEQLLAQQTGLRSEVPLRASPVQRERERLARVSEGGLRERASLILDAAERFTVGSSAVAVEVSATLLDEARSARHRAAGLGGAGQAPVYDRILQFETRVAEVEARRDAIRARVEQVTLDPASRGRAQESVRISGELNSEARDSFYSGALGEGESLVTLAQSVLDVALGVIPGVNVGRDVYELFSGKNLVTGEALSPGEYAFAAVGVLTLGVSDEVSVVGRAVTKAARVLAPEAKTAVRTAVHEGSTLVETAVEVLGRSSEGISNFFGIVRSEAEFVNSPVARDAIREIRYPGIWTKGKYGDSVKSAFEHFKDHGQDFPHLQNALQYVEAAHEFMRNPPAGTLMRVRKRGDKVFYDPSTNVFAVQSPEGLPRTMYKPDPAHHRWSTNLEYFHAQN